MVDALNTIRTAPAADIAALLAALRRFPRYSDIELDQLEPMPVKGLVHEHIRIRGRGLVLRIPRLSQFGFDPEHNLSYQTACFDRAGPSGATPALHAVIAVEPGIPYGALVVEEIVGRAPRLPDDLAVMAECLAAIHMVPLPVPGGRAPLAVHDDPVAGALGFIETQAAYLPDAELAPDALRQITEEIDWARDFAAKVAAETPSQPISLVGTDTHPGNFLIAESGRAVFVDLEKALYGSPALDLAHASIYTSTMWEPESAAALDGDQVRAFYGHYLTCVPADLAEALRPWIAPLRRLVWLRTTSWCARWRVEAAKPAGAARGGGATSVWSSDRLDPVLAAATRARIDDYFDPDTIARIRAEWLEGGGLEDGGLDF